MQTQAQTLTSQPCSSRRGLFGSVQMFFTCIFPSTSIVFTPSKLISVVHVIQIGKTVFIMPD